MSDIITKGIRIKVTPKYELTQSNPAKNKFLFSYNVKISNEGNETSTLISRHWIITNSFGQTEVVVEELLVKHPQSIQVNLLSTPVFVH